MKVDLRVTLAAVLAIGTAAGWADPSATERNLADYARGVYAYLDEDLEEARTAFEGVLERDPDSFALARKTAAVQLDDEDLAAASGTLRHFAKSHPGDLGAQIYYADFLNQNAPGDGAARKVSIEMLEAANERFPHQGEVFTRLINLYETREQTDESRALFEAQFEAENVGPAHWMTLAPIARTLLPGDSPELTERLDTIALKTLEGGGVVIETAARWVSDYYRKSGRLDEAIAVLERHVEAAPDSLTLRTRLGLLLFYAERDEEALQVLDETLRINPDQLLAHKSLARYHEEQGDGEKALPHHAEVLRIGGGTPEDYLELAERYLDYEQAHEARLLLEKAFFNHPESPAIAARLAVATLRQGETTAAARLFRQAESLARDSDDPAAEEVLDADFQLEFATSLREAGDEAAAETRLREAIRGIPPEEPAKSARALRELAGLWLAQDKNRSAAVSLLKRAESLEPGNKETQTLLEKARGN